MTSSGWGGQAIHKGPPWPWGVRRMGVASRKGGCLQGSGDSRRRDRQRAERLRAHGIRRGDLDGGAAKLNWSLATVAAYSQRLERFRGIFCVEYIYKKGIPKLRLRRVGPGSDKRMLPQEDDGLRRGIAYYIRKKVIPSARRLNNRRRRRRAALVSEGGVTQRPMPSARFKPWVGGGRGVAFSFWPRVWHGVS